MALVEELRAGDLARVHDTTGQIERVVHYGGAFDVRIAIRPATGELKWVGANYADSCKRLKPPSERPGEKPVRSYALMRDRLI